MRKFNNQTGSELTDLNISAGVRRSLRCSIDNSLNPIAEERRPHGETRNMALKPNAPSLLSHSMLKPQLNPNSGQMTKRRNISSAHHGRPRNVDG